MRKHNPNFTTKHNEGMESIRDCKTMTYWSKVFAIKYCETHELKKQKVERQRVFEEAFKYESALDYALRTVKGVA